ncbi:MULTISPECIES: hypothetical protein [Arthrospira]|uniref:hypothetical protein n=1 Tax=Oscillatoriales TaxID=1150 RepID=UPI0001D0EF44|nr:hypothetical protein [Arthrospira platensis]MBD2672099.1 hypothetical protein [Arthrospira platensis FACHB-439]MBD2712814.1 hypothetical protein [Arthrospira platensis FACHB-835]MDF2208964.1 hypothetical protein [Arthrospira platensis NCB002]MDT9298195.1 hypothetical protein [Arthrospira platensis PCC 7345]MDT9313400.1 hypothetical protein [Limnospira sp. Paracas R14]QQW29363.1 hypothetical protein AP9108_32420 [Arthrospira sp. PCC 9108]BAI87861.1 hypothetical protein NIES39_A00200 [Arthr
MQGHVYFRFEHLVCIIESAIAPTLLNPSSHVPIGIADDTPCFDRIQGLGHDAEGV